MEFAEWSFSLWSKISGRFGGQEAFHVSASSSLILFILVLINRRLSGDKYSVMVQTEARCRPPLALFSEVFLQPSLFSVCSLFGGGGGLRTRHKCERLHSLHVAAAAFQKTLNFILVYGSLQRSEVQDRVHF